MAWTDFNGKSFTNNPVVVGDPMLATNHNEQDENDQVLQSSKGGILPGCHVNTNPLPVETPHNEGGCPFVTWLTFTDGQTITLVDVSSYYTLLRQYSWIARGFAARVIEIEIWAVNAADVSSYIPGGANDHQVLNGGPCLVGGSFFADDGTDSTGAGRTFTLSTGAGRYTYTFSVDTDTGDLKCVYHDTDVVGTDEAAVVFRIKASVRYRMKQGRPALV